MPIIYRNNTGNAELLLWQTSESEEDLRQLVTAEDAASAQGFTSASRRIERLAWRATLRSAGIIEKVGYGSLGAPFLVDSKKYMGVSHCKDAACLIISDSRCAVDIEKASRNCLKSASRFLSRRERKFVEGYSNPECVAWCVKEALYKYSGREGLDFLSDIIIEGHDDEDKISARLFGEIVEVRMLEVEGYVIASVV